MDDPIDDLTFSKKLRKPKGDISLFDKTAQFIIISPPPINSSLETSKELLHVQGATFLATEAITRSIKKHDKDPAHSIKIYMDLFGLEYDQEYITKLTQEATIVIREQKNKFNRPRPYQLAPYFGVDLNVLSSKTNKTPSYPSGHSTQARLVAEVYAEKYPSHRENILRASEECGFGRVIGGFHFPNDHSAGITLAKRLFNRLKSRRKNTPKKYSRVFGLKQKNRR